MRTDVGERGILFKGHLVREIIADRKTVTRRLGHGLETINAAPDAWNYMGPDRHRPGFHLFARKNDGLIVEVEAPWDAGTRLWVRETWRKHADHPLYGKGCAVGKNCVMYRADYVDGESAIVHGEPWRPSIFMPRAASRLTLEVVSVRVERLQEITDADVLAEGIVIHEDHTSGCPLGGERIYLCDTLRGQFSIGWDRINAKRGSWASNPWVWRIEFRRLPSAARKW